MKKIKTLFIFEILGRPPEHIKKCLEEFINRVGNQPGIQIISKKIHEPHPLEIKDEKGEIKENKDLFTTFAEAELETDNLDLVFAIVLNMLPSNIEIIEPGEIELKNFDLSRILSELAIKLHKYDEIAKAMAIREREFMFKIKELQDKIKELEDEKSRKIGSKKIGKKKDKIKKK